MILDLQTQVYKEETVAYDDTPLSPHWIYKRFGISGSALVAFRGPADVPIEHMVDLEDVKNIAPIYSPDMLHFLGEFFIDSLDAGILLQHHLVACLYESLWEKGTRYLSRRGNDLFFDGRKLSVSIATKSPVSVLVHLGINVDTKGTPLPTAGLAEIWLDPWEIATQVLEKFRVDAQTWKKARVKVLPR